MTNAASDGSRRGDICSGAVEATLIVFGLMIASLFEENFLRRNCGIDVRFCSFRLELH